MTGLERVLLRRGHSVNINRCRNSSPET